MFISITAGVQVGEWKRHVATKNKQGGIHGDRVSQFSGLFTLFHSINTTLYMKLQLHTNGAPDSLSVT